MANKLSATQISMLLNKAVSDLKPGELDDLKATLDSMHGVKNGPDYARNFETALNGLMTPTISTQSDFDSHAFQTGAFA